MGFLGESRVRGSIEVWGLGCVKGRQSCVSRAKAQVWHLFGFTFRV